MLEAVAAFQLGSVGTYDPTLPQTNTPAAKAAVPVMMRQTGSLAVRMGISWAAAFAI